jgi:hypothetical protein
MLVTLVLSWSVGKMNNEITINKHDYERVVLTEVQPYELPFILTNEGFYGYLKSSKGRDFLVSLFGNLTETLPFDFKITKTNDSFRKLSLIHPFGQSRFADFYRQYNELIKSKCDNSKYSLRYPVNTALYYYESEEKEIDSKLKDEGVDIHEGNPIGTPPYASSFYTYKNFNFLYKFYDSYTFHRIERKFSKLHKFDISKCFENMSPDMLPSTLRGEEFVKDIKDSKNSFENVFSELIAYVNFGRTHGIVIGPEFSRIYAEMLLQQIDKVIELSLSEKGLTLGKDYIIRRYVDDYFLFYNESTKLNLIKKQVTDTLSDSKLFINESKDEYFERPFISGVTNAKLSISEYFNSWFGNIEVRRDFQEIKIKGNYFNYSKLSNSYITKLKSIVKKHNIQCESISGYFFTILKRKITEINECFKQTTIESSYLGSIARFLLMIIDVMFFVYSMDTRVRATYLVSEIIIQISEISKKLDYEDELMISDKILQEVKFSIKNSKLGTDGVESLNLALSLQTLNTENSLSVDDVKKLIGFKDTNNRLNYFQLIVGLYFIKKNKAFYQLKIKLCQQALEKISNSKDPFKDSELTHIIFDLFSCPHLSDKFKKEFLDKLYLFNVIPEHISKEVFYKEITRQSWFVDWSDISIKRLLKKKQLRSPY